MAAALGRLAEATAESRFADGALRAIAYEYRCSTPQGEIGLISEAAPTSS
jgi:hypothetical protein